MAEQVCRQPVFLTALRVLRTGKLRKAAWRCIGSIFYNFFYLQYKAALFRGRIPVTSVDHPLDEKIPFTPGWVTIYLDFVSFWIRTIGFLIKEFGRDAEEPVREFLDAMGDLYRFAAEVYTRNLSTTRRPRYLKKPRFILIHTFDPHLMCIPSLHVMVVIRTYTKFADIIRTLGDSGSLEPQKQELKQGAQKITEAILYIKQHSVNCVSAAMYAMTRFDVSLFTSFEAESFVSGLFTDDEIENPDDRREIRDHILGLYRRFMEEGDSAEVWHDPLITFLKSLPLKK
ncbi:hypothetical protein [Breznakiella homolactica]|uniref:Uncharacterized protein n=1 Tax=Breznakiella homolactica TaxID=2798577 RepID=A0A7T7XR28_9SPIR|nr:hypothetical protein [Breznakiella homolactica]QQO10930.1 hypothetical protein JFL75_08440 [Breznakiella homolactica]